jgi:glycerophosphoryl diester phosphodiesterase
MMVNILILILVWLVVSLNTACLFSNIHNFLTWCSGKYPILRFEEYIEIALNASRVVGIYAELKNPVFINQHVCKLSYNSVNVSRFKINYAFLLLVLKRWIQWQVSWGDEKRYEDIFVETLLRYGYTGKYLSDEWKKQPIFIQSFAPTSLIYISDLIDSPKILLIDDVTVVTQDTNQVCKFLELHKHNSHHAS